MNAREDGVGWAKRARSAEITSDRTYSSWCEIDDRELVEALSVSTPLSADRAIVLVNAHGGPLLSRLLADGVPWYLLDAAARACRPSIDFDELSRVGFVDERPLARLWAEIVSALRVREIAQWVTDRAARRSGRCVGCLTSRESTPSDPTGSHERVW